MTNSKDRAFARKQIGSVSIENFMQFPTFPESQVLVGDQFPDDMLVQDTMMPGAHKNCKDTVLNMQ